MDDRARLGDQRKVETPPLSWMSLGSRMAARPRRDGIEVVERQLQATSIVIATGVMSIWGRTHSAWPLNIVGCRGHGHRFLLDWVSAAQTSRAA
jgi:hypothetical protein